MFSDADRGRMRFMLPPTTRRDKATARLADGMERVKNLLKTTEWLGLPDPAAVRARYNAVAREADGLCDRRLTVKRHEKRVRAILGRANAVLTWAIKEMLDSPGDPVGAVEYDIGLGPMLRDVERELWTAPMRGWPPGPTTLSNWSDTASATPLQDLLDMKQMMESRPGFALSVDRYALRLIMLQVGYDVPVEVIWAWSEAEAHAVKLWAAQEYSVRHINGAIPVMFERPPLVEPYAPKEGQDDGQ